jgi:hypothetical protein
LTFTGVYSDMSQKTELFIATNYDNLIQPTWEMAVERLIKSHFLAYSFFWNFKVWNNEGIICKYFMLCRNNTNSMSRISFCDGVTILHWKICQNLEPCHYITGNHILTSFPWSGKFCPPFNCSL